MHFTTFFFLLHPIPLKFIFSKVQQTSIEFGISSSKLFHLSIFGCFALNAYTNYECNAKLIPEDEVRVLKAISSKIKNLNWNVTPITPRSCIDGALPIEGDNAKGAFCNCSFSSGKICHVTAIRLRGLNLSGVLPTEFGNLADLEELDLSINCLNGLIPRNFGRLPLWKLDLTGNPISGSIPKEMGNITTLEYLWLRDNMLNGALPSRH